MMTFYTCNLLVFLQGELTITSDMEDLGNALFLDSLPESWTKRAYPSLYGLNQWYADLLLRIKELESWVSDFQLPAAVWLAGFFNPQSFLTAIMQQVLLSNSGFRPSTFSFNATLTFTALQNYPGAESSMQSSHSQTLKCRNFVITLAYSVPFYYREKVYFHTIVL